METKPTARIHYLDWLRVLAILFVFVYHSTRFFNLGDWHIKNPTTYSWLEVWNNFAETWMMPLFYVISGASLFFVIGRGNFGKFAKDKTLRLLVPLLVGIFTFSSIQVYLERVTHGDFSGSFFQFLPHYFTGSYECCNPASGNFAITGIHLWYLWWLFVFSILLYPLLRWLKGRGRRVLSVLGKLFALPGMVYCMAIPTILMLAFVDPNNPLISEKEAGWSLVVYLWLVFCSFVVFTNDRLIASIRRLTWLSLTMGVASTVVSTVLLTRQGIPVYGTQLYAPLSGLRVFSSWCWVLAILGLGMKYLNSYAPSLKYSNEAVLPFYILHQTVLLCVGYFVVQWPIPDWLRWASILLISFTTIMGLYEFLVRRFNLLRFLFGMKVKSGIPGEPGSLVDSNAVM